MHTSARVCARHWQFSGVLYIYHHCHCQVCKKSQRWCTLPKGKYDAIVECDKGTSLVWKVQGDLAGEAITQEGTNGDTSWGCRRDFLTEETTWASVGSRQVMFGSRDEESSRVAGIEWGVCRSEISLKREPEVSRYLLGTKKNVHSWGNLKF